MADTTSIIDPPRTLISYRHESPEHDARVLALCHKLRQDGVDAMIDRYVPAPAEGWSWWMQGELKKADRVIVVCSKGYLASASREAAEGQGRGVSWEWHLIRSEFYESRGAGGRIVPVFFDRDDERNVPPEAWDRPRHFVGDLGSDNYRRLLDDLFRRAEIELPPIGGTNPASEPERRLEPRAVKSTGTGVREGASPRVYISYTHDSEAHKAWVAELASNT